MASDHETIFTMEATPVKFGRGASDDAGWELKRLGVRRAMLVTDPGVAALGHPDRIKGRSRPRASRSWSTTAPASSRRVDSFQDAADFARRRGGRRLRVGRRRLEHRHRQGRRPRSPPTRRR